MLILSCLTGVNAVGVHPGGVPTELGTANPALKPCKSYLPSPIPFCGDAHV